MSDPKSSRTSSAATPAAAPKEGGIAGDLPDVFAEAQEKGYFGESPDPTPNENYTLAGVTSGAPTPETDPKAKAAAEAKAASIGKAEPSEE